MSEQTTESTNYSNDVTLNVEQMRLPADLADRHALLLDAAIETMRAVMNGDEVNTDEGRQVGHYWLRDPEEAPGDIGKEITEANEEVRKFARDARRKYDNVLWLGIGGSGLGPQLLCDALGTPHRGPRFFFLDNTDPSGFEHVFRQLGEGDARKRQLEKTLVVVVSKSGGTKETRNAMRVTEWLFHEHGLKFSDHAVAITGHNSALSQLAASWVKQFPLWKWVGGRTSICSAVGQLAGELAAIDFDGFLEGAREFDRRASSRDLTDNTALLLAATWYHAVNTQGLANMVVLPYDDRLVTLSKYLQQLVMESLGKEGQGITVLGNKGSTDQHSFVQQLREGRADFFVSFLQVCVPERDWIVEPECGTVDEKTPAEAVTAGDYLAAFLAGTEHALSEAGRPSLRIRIDQLNAHTLGALVALFERAVTYYAAMIKVNAYHQPGVEAGKKAADVVLETQQRLVAAVKEEGGEEISANELAKQLDAPPALIEDLLHRLRVNGRI